MMSAPSYYRGMTVGRLAAWITAACGVIAGIATVAKLALGYFDGRYARQSAFAQYTHDDTLRHVYAERQRQRTNFVIDSIEQAHQHGRAGRVLQAGEPRP